MEGLAFSEEKQRGNVMKGGGEEGGKLQSTNLGLWQLTETKPPTTEHAWAEPRSSTYM